MSRILTNAIKFYGEKYKLLDVPYLVDVNVSAATKPMWCNDLHHNNDKVYVASGEQSFIQMLKEGRLRHGYSMCVTPCFRDEEIIDDLHLSMFLKLELIMYADAWKDPEIFEYEKETALNEMILNANGFYSYFNKEYCQDKFKNEIDKYGLGLYPKYESEVVQIDDNQFDILVNGIEVGSYGARTTEWGSFIYGTGVALPRFEQAMQRGKNEIELS